MNSVDFLLTNKDITYEIRTEIKRLGRPIPDLIISKTDVGKSRNYSRNFNSNVYDRLMGGNQSAWTHEGNLRSIITRARRFIIIDPCFTRGGSKIPLLDSTRYQPIVKS
ncbi:hypothetical protein NQ318_017948 [Aromia moschata]|uniref:Uncharacterized protein n=1 Tax=Aromia moschata TaxID=1265417 RepID=A0AAV8Y247_9CUCU|nr:hypothetical protein NQ318_017948 [Aromia moschata]